MKLTSSLVSLILCAASITLAHSRPLLSRCREEDGRGSCLVCNDGFYAHRGHCLSQNVPGCLEYFPNLNHCKKFKEQAVAQRRLGASTCLFSNGGLCLACGNLYYASRNAPPACLPISDINCINSDGFNNACVTCSSGFYVSNGACLVQSKPNCLAYRPGQNYCTSCASPFILSAGNCVASNAPNCLNYNPTTNICGQCAPNYLNSNGGCRFAFDPNCSTVAPLGFLCPVCNSGFYPDPAQGNCVARNVANCAEYVPSTNQCITCVSPLIISGNSCIPFILPNCANANPSTGRCTLCNNLFFINSANGQCVPISASNCGVSNGISNTCTTCANLFYRPLGGSCIPIDEVNCVTSTPNQNLCSVCIPPYVSSLGICVCNGTTACQISNPANPIRCLSCSLGCAVNNNGNCQNNPIRFCKDFSFQTGLCYQCTAPRILNPCTNTCVLSYTPTTPNISFCLDQCGSQCKNCISGRVPSANGQACNLHTAFSLQIIETGQYLVFGADTSPANHAPQTSPTDPAASIAANRVRVSIVSSAIQIQPATYNAYLTNASSGVIAVVSNDISQQASWLATPVPNTIGYFTLTAVHSSEKLKSWTTTGMPAATVKFIPK